MVDLVVESTNGQINETIGSLGQEALADDTKSYIRVTTSEDIDTLFGFYFQGLHGLNKQSANRMFSKKYAYPVFEATMSCKRFKFLSGHLAFDDSATRSTRWRTDRFAAFRQFFEMFDRNYCKHLTPSDYLSLDETFLPNAQAD